ncbi:pyruvate kinase [Falsibacillus pallidus]|uniref:Pyruvate kinase n=1 Tax=Falsibacillus pallidus TaxID=493781 RepID=A0A370GHS0_9BACI|nr:pyruvate kinase [Falsibacillus pallidus]RDI43197.1 pyruvate kinase [Falsibacillus pallidus]
MESERKEFWSERRRLYKKMTELFTEIIQSDESDLTDSEFSSRNLSQFLKLWANNNVSLEENLHSEGLGTLKMADFHVEHYIKKILYNLGCPPFDNGRMYDWWKAKSLKKWRSDKLFGQYQTEKNVKVMATLDNTSTKEEIDSLIKNGMDIARINCAHGSPGDWLRLIQLIRGFGEDLHRCKIFMDIPGPKIRIEKILFNPYTVKIQSKNVKKSILGIIKKDSHPFTKNIDSLFEIEIKQSSLFEQVNPGDDIHIKLIDSLHGTLKVVDILSEQVLLVEAEGPFEINQKCQLNFSGQELEITNIKTTPSSIKVKKGSVIRVYFNEESFRRMRGNRQCACLTVSHPKALKNAGLNDSVYFDDGIIFGKVTRLTPDFIELLILSPNEKSKKIKEGKGINFPDSFVHLLLSTPNQEDLALLPFLIEHADIIGLSYVNHPKDIKKMADILHAYGREDIGLVAKIETKEGIRQLSRIIETGLTYSNFGVMIARGDLAVEAGFQNLLTAQENILRMCHAAHLPVIWATGVLNQLTKNGTPTRAEISDVFLASQTECIMLNKGEFLNDSVKMLNLLMHSSIALNSYYRDDGTEFFRAQKDLLEE